MVSKVGRMLNRNTKRGCVLLTTCAAALISTGCRSMPGANMFGWRGEPSASALAGSGPTTTYPAPPSASATPEAIASIAGGTSAPITPSGRGSGTAQVAGFDVAPGYATPASNVSSTNMAAAQANGIYSGTKSAGFTAPPVPKTTPSEYKPSGYAFGSKTLTPKPESPPISPAAISPAASANAPGSPSTYAKASSYTPPASSFAAPATGFSPPATSSYTAPPPSGSSGYTLPTDSPAVAAITPPAASQSAASTAEEPANAFAPPAATAPEFSTASTSSAITAPINSTGDSTESSGSGYTPGSTGGSSGYPSGSETPTTTGSFYR